MYNNNNKYIIGIQIQTVKASSSLHNRIDKFIE